MLFNLSKEWERIKFDTYVEHLKHKQCICELNQRRLTRSLSQNAYLHLLLSYFASELGYDLATVKQDYFKRLVNRETFVRQRKNRRGEQVSFLRSSADLDTSEMTTCIERFRNWSASEAGLYLPSPNEGEALQEIEKQIEAYKYYL